MVNPLPEFAPMMNSSNIVSLPAGDIKPGDYLIASDLAGEVAAVQKLRHGEILIVLGAGRNFEECQTYDCEVMPVLRHLAV